MRPLHELDASVVAPLRGLIFDLDDTLLDHGDLTLDAYNALFTLRDAGFVLVGCTGRPSGWGEVACRMWPTRAIITENGAISWVKEAGRTRMVDSVSLEERARRRAPLLETKSAVLALGLPLADDNHHRISDVAFDIGEHHHADASVIDRAIALMQERGFRTSRSSIHLHMSLDTHDKATGTLALLQHIGFDPSLVPASFAFIGDSPNDEAAFAAFEVTFGVANIAPHLGSLTRPPRFIADSPRGAGFAAVARALARLSRGASLKEGEA
jgi:HAD superfamily hydrolase (TIGR01484 family)